MVVSCPKAQESSSVTLDPRKVLALSSRMSDTHTHPSPDTLPDATAGLPPLLAATLRQFRMLGRDEKMSALLAWSKKLEPLPERLAVLDRTAFTVPECQTRVDLFPGRNTDGTLHFFADVNARQSPTIAAVLAITFAAVNDQPPSVTLGLPSDIVHLLMQDIGLGARATGLNAMIDRIKRHAASLPSAHTDASHSSLT